MKKKLKKIEESKILNLFDVLEKKKIYMYIFFGVFPVAGNKKKKKKKIYIYIYIYIS